MTLRNSEIKVSVIVPVYNVEQYLRKSIQSIINQTLKDIEIILINDGSTDSSFSIMNELVREDSRIKLLSQSNHGQSIARNIGLVNAVGEYIYFFDSDDILEERALEECYNKCKQEELDFLIFDGDVFTDEDLTMNFTSYNRTNKFIDKTYKGIELLEKQLFDNSFSVSVCLIFINKKYLDNLNLYFYPRIIHEDILFTHILYLKANRIGLINKVYFHRRVRANSTMTTSYCIKNIIGYITVCRELKKHISLYSITAKEKLLTKVLITNLLSELIYRTHKFSQENYNELCLIVKKEFSPFLNFKIFLKLYIPSIYYLLNNLKRILNEKF